MWCSVLGTSFRGRHGVRANLEKDRREAKKGTGSGRRNRRMVVTTHHRRMFLFRAKRKGTMS